MQQQAYTRPAIILHWMIAVSIFGQLASGWWMVRALDTPGRFDAAFAAYQMHKSFGVLVLLLSIARVVWRLRHRPPELPAGLSRARRALSQSVHGLLYVAMLAVPLAGWVVVSASSFGLPTPMFGLFSWPHLPIDPSYEPTAKVVHRVLAYGLGVVALGHMLAALMHHFIDRDGLLRRMSLFRA